MSQTFGYRNILLCWFHNQYKYHGFVLFCDFFVSVLVLACFATFIGADVSFLAATSVVVTRMAFATTCSDITTLFEAAEVAKTKTLELLKDFFGMFA